MATTFKLVKDLQGKEDVNWGDSSSTFTRETHLGGSIDIHFIDAECIPSTGLGGYIGDHLHRQNTDTGTTSTSFLISSAGNGVSLSASGLSATHIFTFPDGADQELVGGTDLSATTNGKGISMVGIEDAAGYFTGTDGETVLAELGANVNSILTEERNHARKSGFTLGYSSPSSITITGGMWGHNGTTNQYVYTTAQLTFTLGSAGSNSGSSDLGPNELHYIYIDDSAVVTAGTAELTAAEFINRAAAGNSPTYAHDKYGWYNGEDRCIGAILTDSSNNILKFNVFSNNYYAYNDAVSEFGTATSGTTFATLDLSSSVPVFATRTRLRLKSATAGTLYYFGIDNTSTTPEAQTVSTNNGLLTFDVPLSASQVAYWYASGAVNTDMSISGYYIDNL